MRVVKGERKTVEVYEQPPIEREAAERLTISESRGRTVAPARGNSSDGGGAQPQSGDENSRGDWRREVRRR